MGATSAQRYEISTKTTAGRTTDTHYPRRNNGNESKRSRTLASSPLSSQDAQVNNSQPFLQACDLTFCTRIPHFPHVGFCARSHYELMRSDGIPGHRWVSSLWDVCDVFTCALRAAKSFSSSSMTQRKGCHPLPLESGSPDTIHFIRTCRNQQGELETLHHAWRVPRWYHRCWLLHPWPSSPGCFRVR
jgi:hypothetical protein